jgi:hypothetical protein
MKFLILAIVSVAALIACEKPDKGLTVETAQKTLNRLTEGRFLRHGDITVDGIRTVPVNGFTIVDVTISQFGYQREGAPQKFTGKAEARFQGYTNGRWILKELHFSDAGREVILDPNIEAPQ